MEGDGPGLHGKPRPVGLLLASPDAVALDVVACLVSGTSAASISLVSKNVVCYNGLDG